MAEEVAIYSSGGGPVAGGVGKRALFGYFIRSECRSCSSLFWVYQTF